MGAYSDAAQRFDALPLQGKVENIERELSAGCLIKQLRQGRLTSGSPTECDNGECNAHRPDIHTERVALGSTCITDARPADNYQK